MIAAILQACIFVFILIALIVKDGNLQISILYEKNKQDGGLVISVTEVTKSINF